MTGNFEAFTTFEAKESGSVSYGDNAKGKILGAGNIGSSPTYLKDVLLVEGLKHNLISISQLCDKGYSVKFSSEKCEISHNNTIIFIGYRDKNIYSICLLENKFQNQCLVAKSDESWLWHRRLGHANIKQLSKLM